MTACCGPADCCCCCFGPMFIRLGADGAIGSSFIRDLSSGAAASGSGLFSLAEAAVAAL